MTAPAARPRVVFINRVYRPAEAATAQLLTDLAESLAGRGWPVQVISTGEDEGTLAGVTVHRTGPTLAHRGFLSQARNYRRFEVAVRQRLAQLLQPGDLVVPMTDPPLLAIAASRGARARGATVVPWIQDIYPEVVSAHFGGWAGIPLAPLRWSRNRAWRAAAACVPVGRGMAQQVVAQGVPAGRVHAVPNWAPRELDKPAEPSAVQGLRTSWGLADKFIVAYSGNLGRVHEFATFLGAADVLRAEPSIAFLYIGDGPRLPEVRAAVERGRLGNVRFLPPCPRAMLATSLAAADVHLASLRPRFASLVSPSKLAGALAAGRPVAFVGPPDAAAVLAHEQCGAIFAPGDAARLAATLRGWHADRGEIQRLGAQARAAYTRHHTLGDAVARWEEILLAAAGFTPMAERAVPGAF